MTDETVKQLLLDFYSNQDNVKLVDYYTSQSFFDVVKKSRSETVHSAFLAWLLAGKEFPNQGNNSPLMHFFHTLLRRKYGSFKYGISEQKHADFDDSLADAIYAGTLRLSDINIETEKPVKDLFPDATNKDKLDIFITCDTNIPTTEEQRTKKLNIIIENKVGSVENPPEDKSINAGNYSTVLKDRDHYKQLFQTDKYYCACNSGSDHNTITLFVFLSVLSQKELDNFSRLTRGNERCWCEHYIQICYQDLLDNLIEPQLEVQNMPEKATSWLNEYIKCLSVPAADIDDDGNVKGDDKQIIMAVTHSEQKRLLAFMGENEDNCSNKELLYTLFAINASKNYYSVNGKGLYSFEDALMEVFKGATEELCIRKKENGNKFWIIHSGEKGKQDTILCNNLFLNVNCETDYAIKEINNTEQGKDKKIGKIEVTDDALKLLDPFWSRNQALILSALHILSDRSENGIYADLYGQLSTKDNTKFRIGTQESCSKIQVVRKFIEHLWNNMQNPNCNDINKEMQMVSKGTQNLGILITERQQEEQKEKDEKLRENKKDSILTSDRYKPITLGGKKYYLSNQWGGKYNSTSKNENFPKFWAFIKNYNINHKGKEFMVEVQR